MHIANNMMLSVSGGITTAFRFTSSFITKPLVSNFLLLIYNSSSLSNIASMNASRSAEALHRA